MSTNADINLQKPNHGKKRSRLIIAILSAIVFLVCVIPVSSSQMIYLSGDEFALFATGAEMAGFDWTGVMQKIGYFSYGYSLILVPLFLIFDSAIEVYHAAMIVNCILAALLVPLANSIFLRLVGKEQAEKHKLVYYGLLLCIPLYPCVVQRANLGLGETALIFVTFAIAAIIFQMNKGLKYRYFGILAFLLVFGYAIHQRFLGILFAGILLVVVLFLFKKIQVRQFLVFAVSLVILWIPHTLIKQYLNQAVWYQLTENITNTYAGQTTRIIGILNGEHTLGFLREIVGQLFYIGVATFLIAFVALLLLAKTIPANLRAIRGRSDNSNAYGQLFLFLRLFLVF